MHTVREFLDVSTATSEAERFVLATSNLCARLFLVAGKHICLNFCPCDVAPMGDRMPTGVLLAAVELRTLLAASEQGRQALRDLGFEPVRQDVEGE